MKIPSIKKIYCILLCNVIFLPSLVFASSVYIDTTHSEYFEGDTILFTVRIDSEGKTINAVEGEVQLDYAADSVFLTDLNTSDSRFSLWPSKPLPSEHNTRISFTGGSPGGLVSKDAPMFNIVLKLDKAGQIALSPNNIEVYIHDGKGTKDTVRVQGLTVNVLPKKPGEKAADDWSNIILNDKTSPEPFTIYLGQEDSIFDGKKFLSFNTVDKQSGIAYYEVTEGNLSPVRSSDTYVLQEQNKPVKVVVIAYDSAGNAEKSVYSPTSYNIVYPVIIITIFIILLGIIFRKIRKNKKYFVRK